MKTFLLALGLVISLILQIFFLQSWQITSIVPNVLLAFIVVVSLYSNTEQLLWMGLIAGLFSDIYSSADFGFYLGFYLLVVIVAKYILKFGKIEFSWWRPLIYLAALSFLQIVVQNFGIFSSLSFWAVTRNIFGYVVSTVGVGLIWYLLLSQTDDLIKRLNITKV